jgi:hypothetical protein
MNSHVGKLLINGTHVGTVRLRSSADSWGFGEFEPNAAFAPFAPVFGKWSLLMHADHDEKQLTSAASDELRYVEYEIDRLRATLITEHPHEVVELQQLNIDGQLIQWKVGRASKNRRAG